MKMEKAYDATTQLQKPRPCVISCRTTAHRRCLAGRRRAWTDKADWRCRRFGYDCPGHRLAHVYRRQECDGSTSSSVSRWNIRILYLYCTPGRRSRATASGCRRIIYGMHIPSISHAGPSYVRLAGVVRPKSSVCKTYDSAKDLHDRLSWQRSGSIDGTHASPFVARDVCRRRRLVMHIVSVREYPRVRA